MMLLTWKWELSEVLRLVVGSISILNEPALDVSESIETPSNLDAKEQIE